MTKFLDYVGLQKFKEWADKTYRHYSDTRIETKELIVGDNNDIRFEVKDKQIKLRADADNAVLLSPSSWNENGTVKAHGGYSVYTNLYAYAGNASDLPTRTPKKVSSRDKWQLNSSSIQGVLYAMKRKARLKNQYIIGKAIPIVNSNGGAYFNCYAVASGMLQLKLTRLNKYASHIDWENPMGDLSLSEALLEDVTWHIFVDNSEVVTGKLGDGTVSVGMCGAYLRICNSGISKGFYSLDESKSSFSLEPDMYIYLVFRKSIPDNFKGTSDTLCFHEGVKVWTPKGYRAPFIGLHNRFQVVLNDTVQLQKLLTTRHGSQLVSVNASINFCKISYRGKYAKKELTQYGVYRYRLINGRMKTRWYTVNIMKNGNDGKSDFIVKK